ncbi:hypothetical protein [Amycolatopsis sp. cg9]|uniref:hypothetical protein n=1 Tax=Amycolatopsis sp. cg9 TaxID=3238801 RepID=UPI0035254AD5
MGEIEYGPVLVRTSRSTWRVGYYDDDEYDDDRELAVVYYSEPPFSDAGYTMVPHSQISPVDTDSLWKRVEKLRKVKSDAYYARARGKRPSVSFKKPYEVSMELSLINSLLADRMISARMNEGRVGRSRKIFICYSSTDRELAT